MARVLLIRHCASTAQHPEAPLTEAGAAAAGTLAAQLMPLGIDAVYSSPYMRAIATIAPFAERGRLEINTEPRLCERTLADRPLDDFLDHIRCSFADPDHRAPGGETLRETAERGLSALGEIAIKRHRLAAAVSHGNLISAVLRTANPSFGFDDWRALKNPDLFMLDFEGAAFISYQPLTIAS